VTIAQVLTPGTHYSEAVLVDVARKREDMVKGCYLKALERSPRLEETMEIFLAIRPSGDVYERIDAGELSLHGHKAVGDELLHACVLQEAKTWSYPAHEKDDVECVLYTLRFSLGEPPAVAAPEAKRVAITSAFTNKEKKYDPTDAGAVERGSLTLVDYDEGVALCRDTEPTQTICQWVQLDSMGLAKFKRDPKRWVGTWGFYPSDTGEGTWTLTRR
jgi:hypothetical protein